MVGRDFFHVHYNSSGNYLDIPFYNLVPQLNMRYIITISDQKSYEEGGKLVLRQ